MNKIPARIQLPMLLAIAAFTSLHAQTVVELENLQFKKSLPYQQAFFIEGARQFLNNKAVAGILEITREGCSGCADSGKYYWWNTDNTSTKYRFFVNKPLEYNVKYTVNLTLYQETVANTDLKATIASQVAKAIIELRRNGGEITDDQIRGKITAIASTLTNTKALFKLEFNNGIITPTQPDLDLEQVDIAEIGRFVNNQVTLQDKSAKRDALIVTIKNYPEDKRNKLLAAIDPTVDKSFTTTDVEAITRFLNDQTDVTSSTLAAIGKSRTALGTSTTEKSELLRELNEFILNLRDLKGDIEETAKIIEAQEKKYPTMFDALITNIYVILAPNISISAVPTIDANANDVDKFRFSAVLGAGCVGVNDTYNLSDISYSPYSFLAFKWYLGPVDKAVPRPYLNDNEINKWSILAGWKMNGDIRYKGLAMERVIGIRPVVGIGRDFVKFGKADSKDAYGGRIFTVSLLMHFFSQPNENPFDTDKKLNIAPSLNLAIDLDVVNRLKKLLNGTDYSLKDATK